MQDLGRNITQIDKVDLLSVIMENKNAYWRLGSEKVYEISQSFCKDLEVAHYRLVVAKDEGVPSISRVYRAAILYENEMRELFGLNVEHMKVDYQNKLYRIEAETPFVPKEEN